MLYVNQVLVSDHNIAKKEDFHAAHEILAHDAPKFKQLTYLPKNASSERFCCVEEIIYIVLSVMIG